MPLLIEHNHSFCSTPDSRKHRAGMVCLVDVEHSEHNAVSVLHHCLDTVVISGNWCGTSKNGGNRKPPERPGLRNMGRLPCG